MKDRNASFHTYTKIYPCTLKTLLRKAKKDLGVETMNQLMESDIRILLKERIENYHQYKKMSESYNITSIISTLTAFQKGVLEFGDIYESWNEIDFIKMRKWVQSSQVVRRGNASSTMRLPPEQALAVIDSLRKTGNKVKNRELVINCVSACSQAPQKWTR